MMLIRPLGYVLWVLAVAGLTHFASLLLMPHLAPTTAWDRLGRFEAAPGFQRLPPATPLASPIRLADPATVVLICRFDLDEADSIAIRGGGEVPYWGLFLHEVTGAVFYGTNNRALGERRLDLRIMPADDVASYRAEQGEAAEGQLIVGAPRARGFVVLRALVPHPSMRQRIEADLDAFQCGPADG